MTSARDGTSSSERLLPLTHETHFPRCTLLKLLHNLPQKAWAKPLPSYLPPALRLVPYLGLR
jgi:hypothetical protein